MQICGEDIKHFKRHLTTHISLPRTFGFESSFANDIEQSLISSEHPSYITFIMSFATAAKKKKGNVTVYSLLNVSYSGLFFYQ